MLDLQPMPEPERRGAGRVPVQLEVEYSSKNAFLSDYAINLSRGGLFLETRQPSPVGTPVALRFVLPDETVPVEVLGEVAWVNDEGVGQLIPGMGIEFRDVDENNQQRLARFVQSLQGSNGHG